MEVPSYRHYTSARRPENDAETGGRLAPGIDGDPDGEGGAPRGLARVEEKDSRQRGASERFLPAVERASRQGAEEGK